MPTFNDLMEEQLYRMFLKKIKTDLDLVQLEIAVQADSHSFIALVETKWSNRVGVHIQEMLKSNEQLNLLPDDQLLGRLGLLVDQVLSEFKRNFN